MKSQQLTIESVAKRLAEIRPLSDRQITDFVNDLRESVFTGRQSREEIGLKTLALSKEAIYRVLGLQLYDAQLLASDALIRKQVAEMQTGEGKTLAAAPAAVFGGILGVGAHVATPNSYLAQRDFEQLKPVYEFLSLSVGLLDTEGRSDKCDAYACDITYGPGYEFGFDYLRDQLLLKQREQSPPGSSLLDSLQGKSLSTPAQIRGLKFSIVDEVDNVLVDDASSPQVLSEFQQGEAPDKDAILVARKVASTLVVNEHFREPGPKQIELTRLGIEFVHDGPIAIPVDQLVRPWAKYMEAALRAARQFHRDIHYVIDNQEVRIVDESTGRIFQDRSWQAGLHQAIEAKEGVPVTPESIPLAQITRQRFYRLYEHLSGMTGTANACQNELQTIYGLGISIIPLRVPSRRQVQNLRAFDSQERKWHAISESVVEMHRQRRPVLVGTRTIRESLLLADLLTKAGLSFLVLNGRQDADEADVIARAGQQGAITIATNLAGRGTDIKLGNGVSELGGIHVIVSECHASTRVDRQLIGRCARQGDPGSAQTFVSADDWLLSAYGPWLADSIRNIAVCGEVTVNLEPKIRRIQNQVERQGFAQRLDLMRVNDQQNKILQRVF